MTALIVVTLYTTARYVRHPSARGAVALFVAAGAAFLAKAMAVCRSSVSGTGCAGRGWAWATTQESVSAASETIGEK